MNYNFYSNNSHNIRSEKTHSHQPTVCLSRENDARFSEADNKAYRTQWKASLTF